MARTATLRLNSKDNPTLLRVTLPHKVTEGEFAKLTDHIIQNIVKGHTGCTCLSGTISVVFDNTELQNAVSVEL